MKVYLSNISLEEGLKKYINEILSLKKIDTKFIDVDKSLNKVASDAVFAKLSSPFYNCSAMDGVAVKSKPYIHG